MATELNTNKGVNAATKHLWNSHQANEYLRVDNYKEGYCYNCASRKAVGATVTDMCEPCFAKRNPEGILAQVSKEASLWGLCFYCGEYKEWIIQYNVRLCQKCQRVVADVLKRWNKKGGMFGNDPFWLKMKKKYGNDWKALIFEQSGRRA